MFQIFENLRINEEQNQRKIGGLTKKVVSMENNISSMESKLAGIEEKIGAILTIAFEKLGN